jgi:uncharacterized protein YaaN involved in tellurite resistance
MATHRKGAPLRRTNSSLDRLVDHLRETLEDLVG